MVGASKILTVSYGTFSCTLEGFDEPFNTMKAIAEYFRDLAADDRYFGAEPPQPDAEMLHKIAEREIQRRVDAKIQKNGVILRPQELAAEEAPPEAADPAPAAEPVTETAVEAIAEPVAEAPAEIAAETAAPAPRTEVAPPAPVFAVPPSADPVSDSVAAKLQRIRAAVASARAAAEERAHPAAPEEAEEVEPAPFATALPEAAPAAEGKFSFDLDISGPLQSEEEEEAASEPAPSEPVAPEPEARAEAEDEAEEASAAAEDRAEEPEALSADAIAAEDEALDRLEARRRRRAERRAARAAEEAQAAEEAAAQAATEEAARIAEEAEEAARAEAEAAERAAEAQAKAEAEAREAAEAAARAEAEAAARAAEAEAKAQAEAEAAAKAAEEAQAEAEPETPALPVAEQPRPTIRARVIKVRRADALRLTAAEVPAAPNDSGLTPEQEAELLAELAMLEGEDEDAPVLETVAETAAVAEEPAASTEEFDIEAFAAAQAEAEQIEAPEPAALREMLEDDEIAALIAAQQAPEAAAAMAEPVAEETVAEEPVEEEAILEAVPAEEPVEAPFVAEEPVAEEIVAEEPAEETVAEVAEQPAAEIAIEIAEEIEEEAPAEPVAARRPEVHLTGAARPSQPPPLPETDLSRLMDKADAQLSGSENRRRISAIAHLKAAVAATVADRRAGASAAPEDETRPYREDLTHAVRPRRPVSAAHAATPRPTPVEARPAPLVLVSEQRVDRNPTEAQVQAAAIRPRRISAAQIHHEEIEGFDAEEATPEAPMNPAEAASFAEFAESLGTQGLSDLLEAAAAYTAQIEGRPHFSPPQIMRKLSAIGPEGDFSREDRLRVFGKLLRQGKIAKVKRGQYAITEASQYYGKRA